MAGEYDERFDEITGLLQKTVGGLDELRLEVRDIRSEVRDIRNDVQENTRETKAVGEKVATLSGQFRDVASMAIKDNGRIDNLEERVEVLEAEAH